MIFGWFCSKCSKAHPVQPVVQPLPEGGDPLRANNRCPDCRGIMEPVDSVPYKGYQIRPMTRQAGSGEWTAEVRIERHTGSEIHMEEIIGRNTYPSEGAAVAGAIKTGKQAIDGELKGVDLKDL